MRLRSSNTYDVNNKYMEYFVRNKYKNIELKKREINIKIELKTVLKIQFASRSLENSQGKIFTESHNFKKLLSLGQIKLTTISILTYSLMP